jgi:seryl-tRNA synthetase
MDTAKIFALKQEITALLKEHPELQPLQDEIYKAMAKAGNQHNRCVIIQSMMIDKVCELKTKLEEMTFSIENEGSI